jgi:putative ABC transport system ATP-binding protein
MRLELRNVSLQYPDKPPLFEGVNLTLESGGFMLIRGVSGSGKSSLLRLLNRLQEPTSGEIRVNGDSMAVREVTELRRKIGYVQQTPVMLEGTVEDNLMLPFGFRAARRLPQPSEEDLRRQMDDLKLGDVRLSDNAEQLSVGQKQRVALIRSLSVDPEVLLCDEPTSALDDESKGIVESRLERINVEQQIGIVMVTHAGFVPKQVRPAHFELGPPEAGEEGGA